MRAGVRQVQGTINGLGERCGNANMIALIPNLVLKMGFETGLKEGALQRLTHLSRLLDDRLNVVPNRSAAYVGTRAFAHKGGLHVSAVEKDQSGIGKPAPSLEAPYRPSGRTRDKQPAPRAGAWRVHDFRT